MSISFSLLLNISFAQQKLKADLHSHSAKCQNIVTLDERARSTWLLANLKSIAVAWVWIAGEPSGSQPRSNAWTALRHPFTVCLYAAKAKGEKQYSLQLT
jgi:hypothetical protein